MSNHVVIGSDADLRVWNFATAEEAKLAVEQASLMLSGLIMNGKLKMVRCD